jgi:hypothetical protein
LRFAPSLAQSWALGSFAGNRRSPSRGRRQRIIALWLGVPVGIVYAALYVAVMHMGFDSEPTFLTALAFALIRSSSGRRGKRRVAPRIEFAWPKRIYIS